MSGPSLAPVIPIRVESFLEIEEHLSCLFDSLEMCETEKQRVESRAEIERYLELEIRKADGIAGYMRLCKAQTQFAHKEIQRLRRRRTAWRTRLDGIVQYVAGVMLLQSLKRVEGRTSTLTLQPCPASVDWSDEAAVPAKYKTVTVTMPAEVWERHLRAAPWIATQMSKIEFTASKTAAKADLQAKIHVPGARLITDKKTVVDR